MEGIKKINFEIDRKENFEKSIFKGLYEKIYINIKSIHSDFKKLKKYDNIILLLGEYGTGKTFALKSFLKNIATENEIKSSVELEVKDFNVLKILEGSNFENNNSILNLVLSNMFMEFREKLNDNSNKYSMEIKRKVLEGFQTVFESIALIKSGNDKLYKEMDSSGMTIEMIAKMASGRDIKNQIIDLINKYLEFIFDGNRNSLLVIPIDDLDEIIKKDKQVLGEINDYFMIPNVLLIATAKQELLNKNIEKELGKNSKEYLNKMIPKKLRILIPKMKELYSNISEDTCKNSFQDCILKIIFVKTGLIFDKDRFREMYLIPKNMYELQSFVSNIAQLEDVYAEGEMMEECSSNNDKKNSAEDFLAIKEHNIKKFKEYLIEEWALNNVSHIYEDSLNKLYAAEEEIKPELVVNEIRKYIDVKRLYKYDDGETRGDVKKIQNIIGFEEREYDVSLGDVIYLIYCIENKIPNLKDEIRKYLFVIKALYSLEIHKLWGSQIDKENIIKSNVFNRLIGEFKKMEKQNSKLREKIEMLSKELESMEAEELYIDQRIEKRQKERTNIQDEVLELKNTRNKLEEIIELLDDDINKKKNERKDIINNLEVINRNIQKLNNEEEKITERLIEKKNEVQDLDFKLKNTQKKLGIKKLRIKRMHKALKIKEKRFNKARRRPQDNK